MNDLRIASFIEYVVRPLTEDWRAIIDQVKTLNIGITEDMVRRTAIALGIWHVFGEIIRAVCYVAITWIICDTVRHIL